MRPSIVISAVVAALVGFGGTLAIIVSAARATGADTAQVSSWVTGLCIAMLITSGPLSLRFRMPIVTAWSTPGAALVAASAGIHLDAAIGAFLLAGALIVLTALFRPIGQAIQRIPASIAAAMLAGILLHFVLGLFEAAQAAPLLVLPLLLLFLVARLASPSAAILVVLVAGIALAAGLGLIGPMPGLELSRIVLTPPAFEPAVLVGLGLPLYLVTMASQNLPGFAVLRASGYTPPSRPILAATGLASLLTAPLGAHTTCLAAITAAICTGPDTHPDPAKRWMTGPIYSLCYAVFALFGASLVGLFAALPGALVTAVAGMALIGALVGSLGSALASERERFAAVLTLAVTASGISLLGIGAAFWGLTAGLVAFGLDAGWRRLRQQPEPRAAAPR